MLQSIGSGTLQTMMASFHLARAQLGEG